MKITAVILLAACLSASATGKAQKVSLTLRDAPLEKALKEIKRQTGLDLLYTVDVLQHARPITIELHNADLRQALDQCFKDQLLTYTIVENVIVVKLRPVTSAEEVGEEIVALPIDVKGRVVDTAGNPVAGASVTVKGNRTKGTTTDENGYFELKGVEEDAVLVVSGVNIESLEVKIFGRDALPTITVINKTTSGEEVVINTGYQKLSPNKITGSYQVVNNLELNQRVGANIINRLDGVSNSIFFDRRSIPGNQSTTPLNKVLIRGLGTVTASMQSPLIIVNNLPYLGDINNINPNDVESITILKDAASTSIYGAKAANGVIVISTKQAKYNQPTSVSLNSNIEIFEKPRLFYYPQMSTSDFIDVETMLFEKGFYNNLLSNTTTRPALTPVVEILSRRRAGLISQADSATQINALRNVDVRKDFDNHVYRSAVTQQYSLNITGGSPKMKYRVSGGYDKAPNSLVADQFERITVRSDNTFFPTDKIELQFALNYSSNITKNNSIGNFGSPNYDIRNGYRLYPYAQFLDPLGNYLTIPKVYRMTYVDTAGNSKLLNWSYKPLDEINLADNKVALQDVVLNLIGKYIVSNSVNFVLNYQYESSNIEVKKIMKQESFFVRDLVNQFTQVQNNSIVYPVPLGGVVDVTNQQLVSYAANGQVNYFHKIDKHEFSAIGAAEIKQSIFRANGKRYYGFDPNTLSTSSVDYRNLYKKYGNLGFGTIPGSGGISQTTDRFVSILANLAYTYDNRLIFSLSGRRDASNLFGVDINNKWQPFWSVGGAWVISNELFYNNKSIPYLKLRSTYGYQGNVNNSISPYTIIQVLDASVSLINQPYGSISSPGNPSLSWEKLSQVNLGLDFKSANNIIIGSIEVFRKKSNNLILNQPVDPTSGISGAQYNSGGLNVKGIDINLNAKVLDKEFRWNIGILFSHVKSKITSYLFDDKRPVSGIVSGSGATITFQKGISPYAIYSFPFAGLDPQTGDPQGFLGKSISKNYLAILNQSLDTANLIYHGSAIPNYFGSVNNSFSFKGVSINFSISYKFNYFFRKGTIAYSSLFNNGITHPDFKNRWKQTGDENYTTIPSMIYPGNPNRDVFYYNSSANTLKADNIRLQYIKVGYDLKDIKGNTLPFKNLQFYVFASNLGIIWRANKHKLDPDEGSGMGLYPAIRSLAVGFNCIF